MALGSLQVHDDDGEDYCVDAFSKKELARRPEVRFINKYAVLRTYVLMGLRGIGGLELLWATVVLLGGFVSSLNKKDFWYITFIALVQAAGMFNARFDNQLKHLIIWKISASAKLKQDEHVGTWPRRASCASRHAWSLLKGRIRLLVSKVIAFIVVVVLDLGLVFCIHGPIICAGLSAVRLRQPDFAGAYKDVSQDNLKRGLDLFYFLSVAQGIIFMFILIPAQLLAKPFVVYVVSQYVGLSRQQVFSYCVATEQKHLSNLASCDESWNLITYGAGLLDSEMPEDNATGARLLTTLIEHGVPVRRLMLRSPRHRIHNLIGTLAWRSPSEGKMRWLAARIVQHVARELSLAQFPGALECISSLLGTSGYYNKHDGYQEATNFVAQLRLDKKQQGTQGTKQLSINSVEGTNEDLISQGLRILEQLALDERNCEVICSTESLLSKIVAPVSSEKLIQDTKTNTAWAKVTDGSLKLLSQLMRSLGDSDTGKALRRRVADNSYAVKNLEEVLALEINSSNITGLQIRAIEVLEQLCSSDGESTYTNNSTRERIENLLMKLLHIFLTDKWMEDYLSKTQQAGQALAENKTNAAHETARHLKEKAGEALGALCMGNQINTEYITRFTGCVDIVHYLTEMLDCNERSIRCRSSAAVILKHLCTHCTTSTLDNCYVKETTLKKVLIELLHINTEGAQATSTSKLIHWQQSQGGNDIENQRRSGGHNEHLPVSVQGHKQQQQERRLQVALLSLCAAIRGRWIDAPDFASVLAQLASPQHLSEKLKKLVEENRYATPLCLATVKLTCELVTALIPHDHRAEDVKMKEAIVDSLYQASRTMAGLESCMLFAGTDHDCYGLPVKPFCSDLVKEAQEVLRQKGRALGLNIV